MTIALSPTSPADEPHDVLGAIPLGRVIDLEEPVAPAGSATPAAGGSASRVRRAAALVGRHRALSLVVTELVVLAAAAALVGSRIPGLVSSVGSYLDQLRHPSPVALGLAVAAEATSLFAVAMIPRLLVGAHGSAFGAGDAVAVGLTANGLAVVLPGGSVPSSVWLAHQLTRRGARPALAAWAVLASGFASSVTLILLLLIGAGVASVISPVLAALLVAVVLAGSLGFLALVHRVDALAAWSAARDHDRLVVRLTGRFVGLAAEAAQWRAGWRTGGGVLLAAVVNWLGDAACLVAVFGLVDSSVPWRSVLVAYAAGQLLGAVVPLPGGLGAVEGGLVGTLVALGSPAGPVILVVAIYRLLGYWLPAVAALPAYGWARRDTPAIATALQATAVQATALQATAAQATEPQAAELQVAAAVDSPPVISTPPSDAPVLSAPLPVAGIAPAVAPVVDRSFGFPRIKRPASDRRAARAFIRAMCGPVLPGADEGSVTPPVIDLELIGSDEGDPVMCRCW